nr:MAG TPA: hypothetical protein [Caudoviricetes sp.]
MELFFLGLIIGEIISDYISPILQAFGEEILLRIERRKTCILNDIKIIKDDIEEEPMTYRKIGFSTEDGDYTNGENEEDDNGS